MSLSTEIAKARKKIVADGYEMSVGELMNLYKDGELEINPEFQRLFRWDISQKTRFLESILLGIPIPPIFVFQTEPGSWELVDGLQRMSTIFEFCGILRKPSGKKAEPSRLNGTVMLPSLADKTWERWAPNDDAFDKTQQLQLRRARVRVEILLNESDESAKFELFQRLNTGGSRLSEQEVRNCVAVMINPDFLHLITELAKRPSFDQTIQQTSSAKEKQGHLELVLRFLAFRLFEYQKGLDVHEYLDAALVALAKSTDVNWDREQRIFEDTFDLIERTLGSNAFKKWNGKKFSGKFLMSVFEVLAYGVASNLRSYTAMTPENAKKSIERKAKAIWNDQRFLDNTGAGVRGTTRLSNLLPLAKEFFKP